MGSSPFTSTTSKRLLTCENRTEGPFVILRRIGDVWDGPRTERDTMNHVDP